MECTRKTSIMMRFGMMFSLLSIAKPSPLWVDSLDSSLHG